MTERSDPLPEPRRARRTIAVFGGSFDPPHVGHVLVPSWLRAMAGVDEVWVVPSAAHAFAKASSGYELRLAWTRAAFGAAGSDVLVSDIEAELLAARPSAPVYALDLLEAVSARRPDDDVRLVVGSDIVESGETSRWHRWEEIERRFRPIVVPRTGHLAAGHEHHGATSAAALPEVSSTDVRAALATVRGSHGRDDDRRVQAAKDTLHATVPTIVRAMLLEPPRARIAVVGLGNAGRPLVGWLRARHVEVVERSARAVLGASEEERRALFDGDAGAWSGAWLTVHDAALADVAASLVGCLPTGLPVLHAAGARLARSEGALQCLARAGHPVGTLHPICALRRELTDVAPLHLDRATFGVEGDAAAVDLAMHLVEAGSVLNLGGLDASARVTYHAACALAANHLAVPRQEAIAAWRSIGLPEQRAAAAFDALMASSLAALHTLGVPGGVSGPAARGDRAALAAHAAALPGEAKSLYEVLSARLVALLAAPRR